MVRLEGRRRRRASSSASIPIGVAATNDVDALLALAPDVVVYNPMWPSVDELVRILEAGIDVVTTAAFITGGRLGDDRQRLADACERGGSSLFGTGVSPGFAELVAITIAGICSRVDKVTVSETADTTFYDSPDTERVAGFGHPIDHPGLHEMAKAGTAVFGEAVAMVADALGVELDEIVCESEFAQTTADLEMASWTIPAGHVAGVAASWQGRVGGRTVVDLNVRWKKGATLEPELGHREGRVGDPRRRSADGHVVARLPPTARLPGRDDRGVHGDRPHHHRGAGAERDPGRRRRTAGHRDVRRHGLPDAAGGRAAGAGADGWAGGGDGWAGRRRSVSRQSVELL